MPTYQYRCTECGRELEVVQKFTDPALTECESCSGALRKVYNAVGVVFKGSGFYRTDSRKADGKGSDTGEKKSAESGSVKTGSAEKSGDKAPAAGTGSSNGSGSAGTNGSGSTSGKVPAKASSTAA